MSTITDRNSQVVHAKHTLKNPFFFYRHVLDFDFEKLCSVSLSHINVYACLVCGKYFQGENCFSLCFCVTVRA